MRLHGVKMPYSAVVSWGAELSVTGGTTVIGENTLTDINVILRTHSGTNKIGKDCSLNPFSFLYGHCGLHVGNYVRIATGNIILPENHRFDRVDIPIYW